MEQLWRARAFSILVGFLVLAGVLLVANMDRCPLAVVHPNGPDGGQPTDDAYAEASTDALELSARPARSEAGEGSELDLESISRLEPAAAYEVLATTRGDGCEDEVALEALIVRAASSKILNPKEAWFDKQAERISGLESMTEQVAAMPEANRAQAIALLQDYDSKMIEAIAGIESEFLDALQRDWERAGPFVLRPGELDPRAQGMRTLEDVLPYTKVSSMSFRGFHVSHAFEPKVHAELTRRIQAVNDLRRALAQDLEALRD